jgi:hypothetical protein
VIPVNALLSSVVLLGRLSLHEVLDFFSRFGRLAIPRLGFDWLILGDTLVCYLILFGRMLLLISLQGLYVVFNPLLLLCVLLMRSCSLGLPIPGGLW